MEVAEIFEIQKLRFSMKCQNFIEYSAIKLRSKMSRKGQLSMNIFVFQSV